MTASSSSKGRLVAPIIRTLSSPFVAAPSNWTRNSVLRRRLASFSFSLQSMWSSGTTIVMLKWNRFRRWRWWQADSYMRPYCSFCVIRLLKESTHDLLWFANPLACEWWWWDVEEECAGLRRNCFRKHRLSCSRRTEEKNSLRRRTQSREEIGTFRGKNDCLRNERKRKKLLRIAPSWHTSFRQCLPTGRWVLSAVRGQSENEFGICPRWFPQRSSHRGSSDHRRSFVHVQLLR